MAIFVQLFEITCPLKKCNKLGSERSFIGIWIHVLRIDVKRIKHVSVCRQDVVVPLLSDLNVCLASAGRISLQHKRNYKMMYKTANQI